jgi:hypothetical protein
VSSQQKESSSTAIIAVVANDVLSEVKDKSWLERHLDYWLKVKVKNLCLLFDPLLFCFLAYLLFSTLQSLLCYCYLLKDSSMHFAKPDAYFD